jgi:hypothetical protein
MLGNNTYKEFARWRDHWMSIMSPRSNAFRLSTIRQDGRIPLVLNETRLRQLSREIAQNRSSQKPRESDSTIVNKASSEPEQIGLETHIWED